MNTQPEVTIVLPISRSDYLQKVFAGLEFMECDSNVTHIVVIVDGDRSLMDAAKTFVETSKFNKKYVEYYAPKGLGNQTIFERREKIADIHNQLKLIASHITGSKYIFGVEDDTYIPPYALKNMLHDYSLFPNAGFIEGVEVGRWGIPYIGAWRSDDVYEPTNIKSIMPQPITLKLNLEEIDSGGFYCFLTQKELYLQHKFDTFENNALGPDANYGMELRQKGYTNFIDWSISCQHMTEEGDLTLENQVIEQVEFLKASGFWTFYHVT